MRDFKKKIFGYSSVRLAFAIGSAFLIVAALIVSIVYYTERKHALADAETRAMIILNRSLATHAYFNKKMKPDLFEWTERFRKPDYFEPSWMSSTFAVREIDKNFKSMGMSEYYYKECAINARSPMNEADDFEGVFIRRLNADPKLEKESGVRFIDGIPYFYVLRRGEVMEAICLRCHSTPSKAPSGMLVKYGSERSFNRNIGDVVSAISIRIPLDKTYSVANMLALELSGLMLLMLIFLFVMQFWFAKKIIFSPLILMRDKAIQITESKEHLGEEIPVPSARELNELATAFNKMSVSLKDAVTGLEEKVQERTSELQKSNEDLHEALSKVKALSGMLPICASCKKIRDDNGYWNQIEVYIREHSEAEFSHGLCPACAKKYMDEIDEMRQNNK